MPKIVKLVLLAGGVAAVSGCFLRNAEPEEIVIIEPAPVVVEPVTTKF